MRRAALLASALLLVASLAHAEDRAAFPLTHWETARTPQKYTPGPPHFTFDPKQEEVFARTVFELPATATAAISSRSLVLELERVRWDASVSLDGKELASHQEGDLRLDLGALAPGKHELLVKARDVRAVAVAGRKPTDDDSVEAGWLEPLGEAPRAAGILGAARLLERLPVEILSVEVVTPTGGAPEIVLALEGGTGGPADVGFVSSGTSPVRTARVELATGERARVRLPWPEAPRCTPGESRRAPVDVLVGETVARRERLAARTLDLAPSGRLRIDNAEVPFFVLDAPRGEGPAAARDAIARARATGANVLATRGERDDAWLETVEAAGLLVLWESDLQPPLSGYALEDERFWRALRRQVLATIERHRGRPSIVAWGLARGVLTEGGGSLGPARARLGALVAEVQRVDPSRLAVLPGDDGRALGAAVAWLPAASATAGSIALLPPAPAPRELVQRVALAGREGFLDDALVEPAHARERAVLALEARARGALGVDLGAAPESEAARAELARALAPVALAPPAPTGGGVVAGERVQRTLELVSDSPRPATVAAIWSLAWASGEPAPVGPDDHGGIRRCQTELRVRPGSRESVAIDFPAPSTAERRELVLRLTASVDGAEVASASQTFVVWPSRAEPVRLSRHVLLADAAGGRTGEALLAAGVAWREAATSPSELDGGSLLVLGEGVLDARATREPAAALVERAKRTGAGVLVLRQTTALPPGLAPPLEALEPRGAHALALAPAASGLLAFLQADLEAWPGEALPPPGLARPLRADARVLLESAPGGVADACAVVACEDGATEEIVCQVPLAARASTLPAVRELLASLVRAACEPVTGTARPLFVRAEPEVELALEALALPPRPWSVEALEAAREPAIFLAAATHGGQDPKARELPLSPRELEAIEHAVARGGTLVVEVGSDTALARFGALTHPGLRLERSAALPSVPAWGPRELSALDLLWPPGPGGLRELASRFDTAPRTARLEGATTLVGPGALLERPAGAGHVLLDLVRWREALNQAAGRRYLARLLRQAGAGTREPPIRLPATAWNGVARKDNVIQFFSNATATARFQARRAGRYRVTLLLGGTPASGGWPFARVHCDAQNLGELTVEGPATVRYEREVVLPAGPHALSVAFPNDAAEAPEDRNLWFEGAVLELIAPRIY